MVLELIPNVGQIEIYFEHDLNRFGAKMSLDFKSKKSSIKSKSNLVYNPLQTYWNKEAHSFAFAFKIKT